MIGSTLAVALARWQSQGDQESMPMKGFADTYTFEDEGRGQSILLQNESAARVVVIKGWAGNEGLWLLLSSDILSVLASDAEPQRWCSP